MISYTKCQEEALHMLDKFVLSNENVMIIEGFAGTGKTTVITTYEKKTRRDIVYLAPTNKAVKVLKDMGRKSGLRVNGNKFKTLHSFFCMEIVYDEEGKSLFKINNYRFEKQLKNYNNPLLILDEISMIPPYLYHLIIDVIKKNKLKMIGLGDRSQLPPIEKILCVDDDEEDGKEKEYYESIETLTPFFKDDFKYHTMMNEVKRTSNPDIKELYEIFRHYTLDEDTKKFKDKLMVFKNKNRNQNIKIYTSKNHFTKEMNNNILKDNSYVICARNATVNEYVNNIRKKLYPNSNLPFNAGEPIYITKYFQFDNSLNCDCYDNRPEWCKKNCFYTSEEYTIVSVVSKTIQYRGKDFKGFEFEINYMLHSGEFLKLYKIHDDDLPNFKNHVKKERDSLKKELKKDSKNFATTKWKEFNNEVNTCNAPFVSSYAITAYKAQGSTYDNIFIDAQDIELCRRTTFIKSKELYTAVTRASKFICIYIELEKQYQEVNNRNDKLKCCRCRCWKDNINFRRNKKGVIVKTCLDCSEKARLKRLN